MAGRQEISGAQVIEALLESVPDVDQLEERLSSNAGQQLLDASDGKPLVPPLAEALPPEGGFDPDVDFADGDRALLPLGESPEKPTRLFGQDVSVDVLGEAAHSALTKIRKDGANALLTDEEQAGAEAVVAAFGRPALLVEGGRFRQAEPPWDKLEEHRLAIETALKSVCRIEVDGHPEFDCVGTGFLVAEDVVMTNRHVAKKFLALSGPPWQVESGMTVRVDFNEEFLAGTPREHEMTEIISISSSVDMALLRVAKQSSTGQPLPAPLRVAASTTPTVGSDVYVIGYPLYNPLAAGGNAEALHRIFHDIYGIKRVQPGQVRSLTADKPEIVHDCSTLGGNSGSCLIDLQTGDVVGLHRKGTYLVGNYAVALADVQDDPALQIASVVFS